MNFVDDIDLVLQRYRRIFDFFPQISDFVNAVVGRGVDFQNVQTSRICRLFAAVAFSARRSVHGMLAVYCARKNTRRAGFAGASCSGEKIGVRNVSGFHLIFQSSDDVILPENALEGVRPVFSVK